MKYIIHRQESLLFRRKKDDNMMELKHIDPKDLIFENKPLKDRINTKLTLQDTDWMNYVLQAVFQTKEQGVLEVKFEFFGAVDSEMSVVRIEGEGKRRYLYTFDSDIFEKYLIKFMTHHLAQWEKQEVFYGGDIVIEFYNEILKEGCLIECH